MSAPSPPPDPTARGRRPALRFHIWHGMLATLTVALGFWGVATFGPVVWVLPLVLGAVAPCGVLAMLPFFLVVAVLCQIAGDDSPPRRDG